MTALTLHRGLDYAVIMRPDDTTDTALVQVKYPTDEDLALLRQMAAGPELIVELATNVALLEAMLAWIDRGLAKATFGETGKAIRADVQARLDATHAAIAKATGAA